MNTLDLECKLRCLLSDKNVNYSVIPCDGLRAIEYSPHKNVCIIVNTKPSNHQGEL